MYNIFLPLIRNIYRLKKLPIKRYSWDIEMKVLELNCEISDFIEKYEKHILKKVKFLRKHILCLPRSIILTFMDQ